VTKRRPTPEKAWQADVQRELHAHAYVVDHSFALPTKDGGWRTGSTWVGKPDLLAVRPPRVLAIEVKALGGRATPQQVASLTIWSMVPCARAWLLPPGSVDPELLRDWIAHPGQAPSVYGFEPMAHLDALELLATAEQRRARAPGRRAR
jgi:hypothetical protein